MLTIELSKASVYEGRILLDLLFLNPSKCINLDVFEDSEHAFSHLPSLVQSCTSTSNEQEYDVSDGLEDHKVYLQIDVCGTWNTEH